jgi:hypothetical protein
VRRLGLVAAVVLCGLLAAPTPSVAAVSATAGIASATGQGSIGLRLVDVPVTAGGDPRARLYVVDHLAPSAVIHRRIQVSNTSRADTRIVLYAAGATIAHGQFEGSAGHAQDELSTWTSITPGSAIVRAGAQLTATVTVAVPRDAAPGEQYGVVWAEARSAPTANGVTEVNRVGIRLYVSVGPGGAPAPNFTIDSLTAQRSTQGRPVVVARVHNTGGRALDLSGTLDLSAGPAGLRAGPFAATLGVTLAIGDTEPVTIALDDQLPAGPWLARVTLHSGLLRHTGQATITFPRSGSSAPVATTSGGSRWLIWSGIALLLLVLAIALLVTARRRCGRSREVRSAVLQGL